MRDKNIIQKANKGNRVIIADKEKYVKFGLNTERYSECGKIRTRKYSLLGHFSRSFSKDEDDKICPKCSQPEISK